MIMAPTPVINKELTAYNYIKAHTRMCDKYVACDGCPLNSSNNGRNFPCHTFVERYTSEAIAIVEQWAKDNPVVTNLTKLKEVFGEPDAMTLFRNCYDCIYEWFHAEYKGGK